MGNTFKTIYKNTCNVCKKEYETHVKRSSICSNPECVAAWKRQKKKLWSENQKEKEKIEKELKRIRKKKISCESVNKEAIAHGMTYGKYCAMLYAQKESEAHQKEREARRKQWEAMDHAANVKKIIRCLSCHKEIDERSTFCMHCGCRIKE